MAQSSPFHLSSLGLTEQEKLQQRQEILRSLVDADLSDVENLFACHFDVEKAGQTNCENLIGSVSVPVGVAGPVAVIGLASVGDERGSLTNEKEEILIPLATSEGALVASIQRGCKVLNEVGGAQVLIEKKGMSRAPVFRCADGKAAVAFSVWFAEHLNEFAKFCEETSSHLQFLSEQIWVRGRNVYVRLVFDTDEAMGMNMVSIAIQKAWQEFSSTYIEAQEVQLLALSSNVCCDKKDSVINRILGRGYWVQAEAVIPANTVEKQLKTTPQRFFETHVAKNLIGSNIAGSFSQNMHVGNAVAAVYLATGQDMAHVTEGSQGATTVEVLPTGELYISVTLPNITVGTVGGGTWLPAQTAARKIIRKGKKLTAAQLAGVVGVAALAGEISGIAALSSNTLAQAHQRLGRSNVLENQDQNKS